jgi:hypothetical protein
MKFISVPIFIISLAIGLFFVYISQPKNRPIYVLPTPDNINSIQYKDKSGTCYEFEQEIIKCPVNKNLIENYVVQ